MSSSIRQRDALGVIVNRLQTSLLLAGATLATAGCVAASATPEPAATPPPPAPDPSPRDLTEVVDELPEPIPYVWADQRARDLGDGWSIGACGGDAPVRCVSSDGDIVGTIELGGYPLDVPVAEPDRWLGQQIDALLASTSEDRTATCGVGHAVTIVSRAITLDGAPGVQYDLRTRSPGDDRVVVERAMGVIAVDDDEVVWLAATGTAHDGCLTPLDGEFSVAQIDLFADRFVAIARGLELP